MNWYGHGSALSLDGSRLLSINLNSRAMNRKKITLVSAVIVVLIVGGASVAFLSPSLFRGLSMSKLTTEKKTEKLLDLDVFVVNL